MILHVTATALNAGGLAKSMVESVCRQRFGDWRLHFLDAASEDDTVACAMFGAEADPRVSIRTEKTRTWQLDKLLPLWRSLPDEDVIAWMDGDDQLATDQALGIVAKAYEAGALLTYGSFMYDDGSLGFAAPVGPHPRQEPWRSTHLKTFSVRMAKTLTDYVLHRAPGDAPLRFAGDQAVMLALLERTPRERAVFIPQILYTMTAGSSAAANRKPGDLEAEHAEVAAIRARGPTGPGPCPTGATSAASAARMDREKADPSGFGLP